MVSCELCGTQCESLVNVKISSSNLKVCNKCKSSGTLLDRNQESISHTFRRSKHETGTSLGVKNNYISLVNSTLAKKSLNFHQLAKATNIKESTLTKYLSSKIPLDVDTARKIEYFLEIKLIDEVENIDPKSFISQDDDSSPLSLGELLKKQLEGNK